MIKEFIYFGVIAILCLVLLNKCNNDNPTTGEDKIISSDTVRVFTQGKTDTIEVERVRIVYRDKAPETFIAEVDTSGDTVKTYTTSFSDSLLEAVVTSKVKGQLLSTNFEYLPLYPKYITRVDTFKQSVINEIEKPRRRIYGGAIFGANSTNFSLQPTLLIQGKKKLCFTVGYDLLNKTYHVGGFSRLPF